MAHLAGNPQLRRQVGGADEQHVDPIHRRDLVRICNCQRALQHHHRQNLGVDGGLCLHRRRRSVTIHRRRAAPRPGALRRVAEGGGNALGLGRRIHVRDDNAECTVVEGAGCFVDGAGTNAHDGRDAGWQSRNTQLRRFLNGERPVLGVDEHPVVAGGHGQDGGGDGAEVVNTEAEAHKAGGHAALGGVLGQGHRSGSPRWVIGGRVPEWGGGSRVVPRLGLGRMGCDGRLQAGAYTIRTILSVIFIGVFMVLFGMRGPDTKPAEPTKKSPSPLEGEGRGEG